MQLCILEIIFGLNRVSKQLIKAPVCSFGSCSPASLVGWLEIIKKQILVFTDLASFPQQQVSQVIIAEVTGGGFE